MGKARDVGVPGMDGPGDPGASAEESCETCGRRLESGGAGLLEEIRRPGRSILDILLC